MTCIQFDELAKWLDDYMDYSNIAPVTGKEAMKHIERYLNGIPLPSPEAVISSLEGK